MCEDHIGGSRYSPNLEATNGRRAPSNDALQPFPVSEGHAPSRRQRDRAGQHRPVGGDEAEVLKGGASGRRFWKSLSTSCRFPARISGSRARTASLSCTAATLWAACEAMSSAMSCTSRPRWTRSSRESDRIQYPPNPTRGIRVASKTASSCARSPIPPERFMTPPLWRHPDLRARRLPTKHHSLSIHSKPGTGIMRGCLARIAARISRYCLGDMLRAWRFNSDCWRLLLDGE